VTFPPEPPPSALCQFDTCRLIPSRFADVEDSVLAPLADTDGELRDLFDLDNATNNRLRGEYGALPGIGVDELVFGVLRHRGQLVWQYSDWSGPLPYRPNPVTFHPPG